MFHANTQWLIEYWRARRRSGRAPLRGDVAPMDFPRLLPFAFMLGWSERGSIRFRLAGEALRGLHLRPLKGEAFLALWAGVDRPKIRAAIERAGRTGAPLVLSASARSSEGQAGLEVLLAPVSGPDGEPDRLLGLYQPTSALARLGGAPIEALRLRDIQLVHAGSARLKLVVENGRRVA